MLTTVRRPSVLETLRRHRWVVPLAVIVLVMLVGPLVVGGTARSQDRGAKAALQKALRSARTIAERNGGEFETDKSSNTPLRPEDLQQREPSLKFAVEGAKGVIGVYVENSNRNITLFTQSRSGTWFGIVGYAKDSGRNKDLVRYCHSTGPRGVDDSVQCRGSHW